MRFWVRPLATVGVMLIAGAIREFNHATLYNSGDPIADRASNAAAAVNAVAPKDFTLFTMVSAKGDGHTLVLDVSKVHGVSNLSTTEVLKMNLASLCNGIDRSNPGAQRFAARMEGTDASGWPVEPVSVPSC